MFHAVLPGAAFSSCSQRTGHKAVLHRLDLIIMDMSLPLHNGWKSDRRLRREIETERIPVWPLTAHAIVRERDRAAADGYDNYDTKPVDLPRLVAKIGRLRPRRLK